MDKLANISLDKIVVNGNVRTFDPTGEDISKLAESMQRGLQQPVRVHKENGHYVLDFGHRRLAAARMLNWDTITTIVSDSNPSDADVIVDQFHENAYRQDMSYLDKARTYQKLVDCGKTQADVARELGVSTKDVSLGLAALNAPEKIQKALNDGRISPSAVEPLLSQDDDVQEALADAVIAAKSVRKVRSLVKTCSLQKGLGSIPAEEIEFDAEIDPLELMAVTAMDEAIEHLRIVPTIEINNQAVRLDIKQRVATVMILLAGIERSLSGENKK